jgi:radical SAM superfamily enzyme YgiQ (UPF0313 family)
MWRPQSPDHVAAEVKRLVDEYDAWIIHFADDNFSASSTRVLEICRLLQQGPLPAFIMASARGDDLVVDPRLIPAMAAARILRVTVGVETAEPEMAARAGKLISLETYREAFTRMKEHGIFTVASLIVGLPGETGDMRMRAVEMAVQAGPDSAHFLPFLPLPGVPLAAGHSCFDADPADIRDAGVFSEAFLRHPTVQARLVKAAANPDVRGMLARATLESIVEKS